METWGRTSLTNRRNFSACEFQTPPRVKSWHMCARGPNPNGGQRREVMEDPSQTAPPPLFSQRRPEGHACGVQLPEVRIIRPPGKWGGGGAEVVTGKYPDQKFGIHLSYADCNVLVDCQWSKISSINYETVPSPPHHTQRVIGRRV